MRDEQGYATATFGAIALGLATIAATLLAYSNTQLHASKRSLRMVQDGARLEGALVLAADVVMREPQTTPLVWAREVDGQRVNFMAEPEAGKANAADSSESSSVLTQMLAKGLLAKPPPTSRRPDLHDQRKALAGRFKTEPWRLCAQSFLSPLSSATAFTVSAARTPTGGGINWRVGEVWRLVAQSRGKVADALVRFTGDPDRPLAVLDVQLVAMETPDRARCETLVEESSK